MVREVRRLVLRGGAGAPPAARRALLAAAHEARRVQWGAGPSPPPAEGTVGAARPGAVVAVAATGVAAGGGGGFSASTSAPALGRPFPATAGGQLDGLEAALAAALRRLPDAGLGADDQLRALDAVVKLQGALTSQRALQLQEAQLELQARKLGASLERNGLLSEANEVSSRQTGAIEEGLRARAVAERTRREDAHVAHLCRICADDLLAGLVVMLVSVGAGARGRVASRLVFDVCEDRYWAHRAAAPNTGLFGLSPADAVASLLPLDELDYHACCAGVLLRLAGSFFLLAALAAFLLKRAAAGGRWGAPSSTLALLVAAACGYLGRFAVAGAGGRGDVWLLLWVALCSVHVALIAGSRGVVRALVGGLRLPSGAPKDQAGLVDLPLAPLAALRLGTALVLPALAGWLPFCFDPRGRQPFRWAF